MFSYEKPFLFYREELISGYYRENISSKELYKLLFNQIFNPVSNSHFYPFYSNFVWGLDLLPTSLSGELEGVSFDATTTVQEKLNHLCDRLRNGKLNSAEFSSSIKAISAGSPGSGKGGVSGR